MTFGTILTLLRRRLMEDVADQWDDNTLNTFINLAYALVQRMVRKIDPEAMLFWDYRSSVATIHWYEKPAGTRGPVEVALKKTSADTDWKPLRRAPYYLARDWTNADDTVYCHRGAYIGIFPAPSTSVTNGIQFIHAPTDSMSAAADVPKLETTLHYAIVLWAALIAKGESPEDDSKDAKELARILDGIPADYGMGLDLGQPVQVNVDVADSRGLGSGAVVSNGVYSR